MFRAGVILGEGVIFSVLYAHDGNAAREGRGRLDGIGQTRADRFLNDEAIDDNFDGMLVVLRELDRLGQIIKNAVAADTDKTAFPCVFKLFYVLALAPAHNRGKDLNFAAFRQRQYLIDNLIDRLLTDFPAADGAMGDADSRIEQTQIVVNLRHRADGGAGILGGGFLIDRNGGGEALNVVEIRLLHLPEELTRIGGERLDIAPLAFRVDGVERKRGLSGAGQSREYDQLVARDVQINVFEVVLSRAFDINIL